MTQSPEDTCGDGRCPRARKGIKHDKHLVLTGRGYSFEDLVVLGAELTGTAVTDLILPGADGIIVPALAGVMAVSTLKSFGNDIGRRFLGPRESVRIGAVTAWATQKIKSNIDKGIPLRKDGFFEEQPEGRRPWSEIVEGVLLSAQREYEEKKLMYYANLLGNLPFHEEIDRSQASYLLRVGRELSYRQFCFIAILVNKTSFGIIGSRGNTGATIPSSSASALGEVFELYSRGLVQDSGGGYFLSFTEIQPSSFEVRGNGSIMYNLMELSNISGTDLTLFASLLK